MTIAELEQQMAEARRSTVGMSGWEPPFNDTRARCEFVIQTAREWTKTTLGPLLRQHGDSLEGDNPAVAVVASNGEKLKSVYPWSGRLCARSTIGGANVNLCALRPEKEFVLARLADMATYHFRHYRKRSTPLQESLNGTPDSAKADLEANEDIAKAFYELEALLLDGGALVAHQCREVKQYSKRERSRIAALEERVRKLEEVLGVLTGNTLMEVFQAELERNSANHPEKRNSASPVSDRPSGRAEEKPEPRA